MDSTPIIQEAVKVLRDGGVILYPTDTVWGIGCDATNEQAVARVFEIKRRSEAKSLVLLACDLDMVAKYIKEIPSIAIDLVEVNDAPMTIIYPGAQYLAPNAVAADGSVGIRIPLADEAAQPGQTDRRRLLPRAGAPPAPPARQHLRQHLRRTHAGGFFGDLRRDQVRRGLRRPQALGRRRLGPFLPDHQAGPGRRSGNPAALVLPPCVSES